MGLPDSALPEMPTFRFDGYLLIRAGKVVGKIVIKRDHDQLPGDAIHFTIKPPGARDLWESRFSPVEVAMLYGEHEGQPALDTDCIPDKALVDQLIAGSPYDFTNSGWEKRQRERMKELYGDMAVQRAERPAR